MLWISVCRFSSGCKFLAHLHLSFSLYISPFKPEVWALSSNVVARIILPYARDNFRWFRILTYFSIFIIQVISSWFYWVYQNSDMRNLFFIFLKFMWLLVWCYSMKITLYFAIRPVLSEWNISGEGKERRGPFSIQSSDFSCYCTKSQLTLSEA